MIMQRCNILYTHPSTQIVMWNRCFTCLKHIKSYKVSDHIAKSARSCRFALYSIRKIRPFLSEHASQLLVQALVLSRLEYCNALLSGLQANSIKSLQLVQNAAARLIFNEPKRTHVTPLFINLHWLPIAAHIQVKVLMFAYKTTEFFINCSHLVEWLAQLNPSSWILSHLQETAKNISHPSLFDPLSLTLSILILFYLSVFFLFKKIPHTFDPLSTAYLFSNC